MATMEGRVAILANTVRSAYVFVMEECDHAKPNGEQREKAKALLAGVKVKWASAGEPPAT